jgi:hypothetical protein
MPAYQRRDARAWARDHLVGCSAVTTPSQEFLEIKYLCWDGLAPAYG